MTRKLSDSDRQAVDLVLDRFASMDRADSLITIGGAPAEAHVQSVEKILAVLAEMPANEPAPDLIDRTMRRIAAATPVAPPAQPLINPNQLQA